MTAQTIACRDYERHHPDEWFPETPAALKQAKTLCAGCPIAAQCLEVAMRAEAGHGAHNRYGVFGGRTPFERHALRTAAAYSGGDN